VEATTAPRLISFGGTIDNIVSINLAAEGMILCEVKKVNFLTALITLLASFYALNAAYPKCPGGQSKNVSGWTKQERLLVFRVYFDTTDKKQSGHHKASNCC